MNYRNITTDGGSVRYRSNSTSSNCNRAANPVTALELYKRKRSWEQQTNNGVVNDNGAVEYSGRLEQQQYHHQGGHNGRDHLMPPLLYLLRSNPSREISGQNTIPVSVQQYNSNPYNIGTFPNSNSSSTSTAKSSLLSSSQQPPPKWLQIQPTGITELSGEAGTGKTQLGLSLCVACALNPIPTPNSQSDHGVVLVDQQRKRPFVERNAGGGQQYQKQQNHHEDDGMILVQPQTIMTSSSTTNNIHQSIHPRSNQNHGMNDNNNTITLPPVRNVKRIQNPYKKRQKQLTAATAVPSPLPPQSSHRNSSYPQQQPTKNYSNNAMIAPPTPTTSTNSIHTNVHHSPIPTSHQHQQQQQQQQSHSQSTTSSTASDYYTQPQEVSQSTNSIPSTPNDNYTRSSATNPTIIQPPTPTISTNINTTTNSNHNNAYYKTMYISMGEGTSEAQIAHRLSQMTMNSIRHAHETNNNNNNNNNNNLNEKEMKKQEWEVMKRIWTRFIYNTEALHELLFKELPTLLSSSTNNNQQHHSHPTTTPTTNDERIGLLVLDSIAGLYRTPQDNNELAGGGGGGHINNAAERYGTSTNGDDKMYARRSQDLFTIAAQLKGLAETYGVAIVVMNQVTSSNSLATNRRSVVLNNNGDKNKDNGNDDDDDDDDINLVPSLGLTWSHCVNHRYMLSRSCNNLKNNGRFSRKIRVYDSPYFNTSLESKFCIDGRGVVIIDE